MQQSKTWGRGGRRWAGTDSLPHVPVLILHLSRHFLSSATTLRTENFNSPQPSDIPIITWCHGGGHHFFFTASSSAICANRKSQLSRQPSVLPQAVLSVGVSCAIALCPATHSFLQVTNQRSSPRRRRRVFPNLFTVPLSRQTDNN